MPHNTLSKMLGYRAPVRCLLALDCVAVKNLSEESLE
jgi:hypothetical protein